jgi:hypothetical protein
VHNTMWSPTELSDIGLNYAEFCGRGHDRSYQAWRRKRYDVGQARVMVERPKAVPVIEDDALDDEAAALLLKQTDERLFDAYLAYHDAVTASFPFSKDVSVGVETDEPIGLVLMSDWHIGSEGTDIRRLKSDIELVTAHPRLYVGLGGDVCDNFILDKMASAARAQTAQVQVQWRLFRYLMQPLLESHSLLWVSSGNHDQWTERVATIDPILSAIGRIPVSHIGEGGYVDLKVGQTTYTIWRKHKPTRFNSTFNRTHYLKQMLRVELPREADILVSEHLHNAELNRWSYRQQDRILVNCGSYKVRDRWAEGIGFLGGGYGVPTIVLYPGSRRMLEFSSIADALEVLDGPSFKVVA